VLLHLAASTPDIAEDKENGAHENGAPANMNSMILPMRITMKLIVFAPYNQGCTSACIARLLHDFAHTRPDWHKKR
jgi:hypothetical protein